jgi:hypothetical protein
MAKQLQKEYGCNNDKMADYLAEVQRMEKFFDGFEVRYVPRLDNRDVDHLAWISSSRAPIPSDVIVTSRDSQWSLWGTSQPLRVWRSLLLIAT